MARPRSSGYGTTSISGAMDHAAGMLATAPACARQVIDISGDGENNDGTPPAERRRQDDLVGVTINGLVIAGNGTVADGLRLRDYYERHVIAGPDAFVEVAQNFSDFEAAMVRKLLRELETIAVGELRLSK